MVANSRRKHSEKKVGSTPITRADRIFEILKQTPKGRMRVGEIHDKLVDEEGFDPANSKSSIVSVTVRQDNNSHRSSGKPVRFGILSDGTEEFGFVSIAPSFSRILPVDGQQRNVLEEVNERIRSANDETRTRLLDAIKKMSWQEFESSFLSNVLEGLGMSAVEITPRTRDGGFDAVCEYARGIIRSKALVSAKHWTRATIPVAEVRNMKAIVDEADTAIIITTSKFSSIAKREAKPAHNTRAIVLIDGDLLVDACLRHGIGVQQVNVDPLYVFRGLDYDPNADAGSGPPDIR
jgi:hypothetical protein